MSKRDEKMKALIDAAKSEIQAVLDKYQPQFTKLAQSAIPANMYLCSGMGSISLTDMRASDRYIDETAYPFINNLHDFVWGDEMNANFELPYKMSSKHILTKEVEDKIEQYAKSKNLLYKEHLPLIYNIQTDFLKTGVLNLNP